MTDPTTPAPAARAAAEESDEALVERAIRKVVGWVMTGGNPERSMGLLQVQAILARLTALRARLAAADQELAEVHRKDRIKTTEINLLTTENRDLTAQLTAAHGELVAERQAVFDAIARGDNYSTMLADLQARSAASLVGPVFATLTLGEETVEITDAMVARTVEAMMRLSVRGDLATSFEDDARFLLTAALRGGAAVIPMGIAPLSSPRLESA